MRRDNARRTGTRGYPDGAEDRGASGGASRRTHRTRRTRRCASRARLRTDATPDALLAARNSTRPQRKLCLSKVRTSLLTMLATCSRLTRGALQPTQPKLHTRAVAATSTRRQLASASVHASFSFLRRKLRPQRRRPRRGRPLQPRLCQKRSRRRSLRNALRNAVRSHCNSPLLH